MPGWIEYAVAEGNECVDLGRIGAEDVRIDAPNKEFEKNFLTAETPRPNIPPTPNTPYAPSRPSQGCHTILRRSIE